jgi:uncharacterized protein YbjT (DUF2867 family)
MEPNTSSTAIPPTLPVLVVGATGFLGNKVVNELLNHGNSVRALVRSATNATRLESQGVEIARGDMLDLDSLVAAMHEMDTSVQEGAAARPGAFGQQTATT